MSVSPAKTRKLLSTSSPEGIQIASQVTPTKLAELLIKKGPLPIRHITSYLCVEVPSFDLLSLSKQRRLIMAAMSQVDPVNNVVFEKIGWGQWAVRKVDSDYIYTEGTESNSDGEKISVQELRNKANIKLGWSKKKRLSISTKIPKVELPNKTYNENVITSDSEFSSEEEEEEDDSSELFEFEDDKPVKFANRVPLKISSPPPNDGLSNIRMQVLNRSRINSFDYALDSNNSTTSFNSPPIGSPPSSRWNTQNYTSSQSITSQSRRKSSFNESHVRTKLSSSVPNSASVHLSPNVVPVTNMSATESPPQLPPISIPQHQPLPPLRIANDDTDEEDWEKIGAENLRAKGGIKKKITPRKFSQSRSNSMSAHIKKSIIMKNEEINDDERSAAMALVELMN
jgi:hypothetical protein